MGQITSGRVRLLAAVIAIMTLLVAAVAGASPLLANDHQAGAGSSEHGHCHEDTGEGCEEPGQSGDDHGKPDKGNPNDGKDGCEGDGNAGRGNDGSCPTDPDPDETTKAKVGFGKRALTPVGEPPAEWVEFFHPHPVTGVWGEEFVDLDEDGCYDTGIKLDTPDDPDAVIGMINEPREPHVDDPWNSAGDAHENGAFEVDGVTIYGDPQSTGKWDGLWTNAGFGSRCTLGAHDDTWARAVVVEVGGDTVAMVSLDVVGFFNDEVRRAAKELAIRYPELPIDQLVISSTHTHESVDTMGYWGENLGIDGKFPAYQAFIRSQIIDAVADAYKAREKAYAKFAVTEYTTAIRDSRPPQVIDPYLLAAQFVREDGSTIGSVVNWSNHPEAQGSGNPYISSDFPHGTRMELEEKLGGTAVYFSGSVGGLMTPLRENVPGYGTEVSWERTYALGRLVAEQAITALSTAPVEGINDLQHERREFYMESDNTAIRALNQIGVFDLPTYAGAESWGMDPEQHRDGVYARREGYQLRTEMIAVQFGPALFLTVPGELFPELELGGYGRPDCPAADTGKPYEPVISEQFDAEYQFILGLGQDELGYIVPGYDFWIKKLPENNPDGSGLIPIGALEQDDPCGEGHYEETVSASSVMAPWVTCVAAELAGRNPWASEAACAHEHTHLNPYGINE
jgi:hypothetical protein